MEHASIIVDEMMKQDAYTSNSAEEKRTFLALLRLRPETKFFWEKVWSMINDNYNEDSYNRLYEDFTEFLRKNYDRPWGRLYDFLNSNSYGKDKLIKMSLSQEEQRLYAILPTNKNVLFILSFYVYQPTITLNFFIKSDFCFRNENREQVLHNFKSLNLQNQKNVLSYIKQLLTEQKKSDKLARR